MTTLYRKYRPQKFSEAFGQNYIKIILENQLAQNQLAHAYMFCGPRAVGKTTLARILAKSVNCLQRKKGESEPCGKCEACVDIAEGRAMDIVEIDAASHTGVDNVREHIIASTRVSPVKLKKKVFIIDEVHMLSTAAFNALLKTLEEPPENVLFILCTTEIHKVPQTIISRCQRFDFKRISLVDMVKKLSVIVAKEGIEIDRSILESVARQSDGHMRDAESLLGQLINVSGKKITEAEASLVIPRNNLIEVLGLIGLIAQKEATHAIRLINKLIDEGVDLKVFVSDLLEMLRKILLLKINPSLAEYLSLEMGEQMELKLNEVKESLTPEQVIYLIENFSKAKEEMKQSFITQLPLELVIARIALSSGVQLAGRQAAPAAQAAESQPAAAVPAAGAANGNVTIEDVISKWQEFLVRLKKYNHSLSFILRVCEPKKVSGSEVCLAFKYKFHKDRVTDPNIKSLIEKVLHEVHGAQLTIEAIIDENITADLAESIKQDPVAAPAEKAEEKPASPADNPMINDLLQTFGGKIVS
jgi:DNA polymerase-3 subunit gamma/tau